MPFNPLTPFLIVLGLMVLVGLGMMASALWLQHQNRKRMIAGIRKRKTTFWIK
jgi:hypothetical protein